MSIHRQIRDELAHLYPPDDAQAWLALPQKLLGDRIPAQMIAAGDGDEVLTLLKAVNDGAYL